MAKVRIPHTYWFDEYFGEQIKCIRYLPRGMCYVGPSAWAKFRPLQARALRTRKVLRTISLKFHVQSVYTEYLVHFFRDYKN